MKFNSLFFRSFKTFYLLVKMTVSVGKAVARGTECVSVDIDFKVDQNLVGLDIVTSSSIL